MSPDDIRAIVLEELSNIAPEADPATIDPAADLRDELDLDSVNVLNLVIALHERLGVDIPDADANKLLTLDGAVAYLEGKLAAA